MVSKMRGRDAGTLGRILDRAEFSEWHHTVIDAEPETVWRALHQMRWADLRLTRPLLVLRGFSAGPGMDTGCLDTFRPWGTFRETAPSESTFVVIGKPWSPVPANHHVSDLDAAHQFHEPGWLKYGMQWRLTPVGTSRTLLETTTLCEPTDARARRYFRAYWMVIRLGSSWIRQEMLQAVERLSVGDPCCSD